MRVYELKSPEQLSAIWERQQRERSSLDGDTVPRLLGFFCASGGLGEAAGDGSREKGLAGMGEDPTAQRGKV